MQLLTDPCCVALLVGLAAFLMVKLFQMLRGALRSPKRSDEVNTPDRKTREESLPPQGVHPGQEHYPAGRNP
jgi:hypothetical protein